MGFPSRIERGRGVERKEGIWGTLLGWAGAGLECWEVLWVGEGVGDREDDVAGVLMDEGKEVKEGLVRG